MNLLMFDHGAKQYLANGAHSANITEKFSKEDKDIDPDCWMKPWKSWINIERDKL